MKTMQPARTGIRCVSKARLMILAAGMALGLVVLPVTAADAAAPKSGSSTSGKSTKSKSTTSRTHTKSSGTGDTASAPPQGLPSGPSSMMRDLEAVDPVAAGEKAQADADPAAAGEPALADGNKPAAGNGVKVSEYMTVDIFVQDEDLSNVLQMLSLQSHKNIVASRDVSASVTANLYGVTFYEALDAILNVNGYGYVEKGQFIYVYTLEEIQQIEEKSRKLESKVVQLNYLNATDAAEFVTPLLSEQGQIKTNGDVGSFSVPADSPTGAEEFALAATLVIYDYAENVTEISALLTQLDTRPSQVLVEATILQTALTEANAFGVDFSVLADVEFTDFLGAGGPFGAANVLQGGQTTGGPPQDNQGFAASSTPGNTGGPSTIKLGIISDDIAVFVRALDEVTDTTILSNPKILALNRQPAKVLVGRKIGYLNTTSTETSTTQTVEFLDTGTQLAFRPFVSKDGNIRLELKPRVSEGIIRDATDATGAAVTIPDEITQELTTNVIVPDGSTVVLGGLFKETTTLGRTQVPVLGDIPIIGAAFRGHEDSTDRAEIIFLIRPTIISDSALVDQGKRADEYGERVRAGSRAGLLPWSRDRQTKQLNVEAERLAAEGQTDKARWALRRSLELQPTQPEVMRMQEQLDSRDDRWPGRSILDRVITEEQMKVGVVPPVASPVSQSGQPGTSEGTSYAAPRKKTPMLTKFDTTVSAAPNSMPGTFTSSSTMSATASTDGPTIVAAPRKKYELIRFPIERMTPVTASADANERE